MAMSSSNNHAEGVVLRLDLPVRNTSAAVASRERHMVYKRNALGRYFPNSNIDRACRRQRTDFFPHNLCHAVPK